jgi:Uma2 family endonuclease
MASILENAAVRDAALPISVEQYHQMGETGIIAANTELLHGVIVKKMVKSPEHTWLVQRLLAWLRGVLSADYHLRQEQPLTFDDSEPEPDIAVVLGSAEDFRRRHPETASLVIEVAITSEALDREKGQAYAAANVAHYWLVLPHQRIVECYRTPTPHGYGEVRIVELGDELELPLGSGSRLVVSDLFGT